MSNINFQRTYFLSDAYEGAKERAAQVLGIYLRPDLILFNDTEKSVTFISERLIPAVSTHRPRVLFLFSNPHPHSIHQGMFLSPNTKGRENLFWSTMRDADWLNLEEENLTAQEIADKCLNVKYRGPFELIFYCYYSFPTKYPQEIRKIFGQGYFQHNIEPEAVEEFRRILQESSAGSVVTFNKEIFNLVAEDHIDLYIDRLMAGELIQSRIKGFGTPIYLSFPTGWRYNKEYKQFRKSSLDAIRTAIGGQ
jgi:hypothetical protein